MLGKFSLQGRGSAFLAFAQQEKAANHPLAQVLGQHSLTTAVLVFVLGDALPSAQSLVIVPANLCWPGTMSVFGMFGTSEMSISHAQAQHWLKHVRNIVRQARDIPEIREHCSGTTQQQTFQPGRWC